MVNNPTIIIFFNDWAVHPEGANCGGGETATMALAEAFARKGYRVIACAYLPDGEVNCRGVEYWDFGREYDLHKLLPRISQLGDFYAFAATLVHPFLLLNGMQSCVRKILINHSPGVNPSGLESRTVMHMVDWFVCVSHAQQEVVTGRQGVSTERIVVVRNGFNPELFPYAGPENRDWNQLLYAGRLEYSKGIHNLLGAFTNLKRSFPNLKLSVFGDQSYWPSLQEQIPHIQATTPGLEFYGKVPQTRIAEELQKAGCLVFPSLSFESAGLSVLDAQASGCPVVACDVGGVKEYLIPECGVLVDGPEPQKLEEALRGLLSDQERMRAMSQNGLTLARGQTWEKVAEELLEVASQPAPQIPPEVTATILREEKRPLSLISMHDAFYRTWFVSGISYEQLMDDHETIGSGIAVDDALLFGAVSDSEDSASALWKGLRLDQLGRKDEALVEFRKSHTFSGKNNWQALFRLILLEAELGELHLASEHASELLNRHSDFPLRVELEQLMEQVSRATANA